jgi:hypothetical protein
MYLRRSTKRSMQICENTACWCKRRDQNLRCICKVPPKASSLKIAPKPDRIGTYFCLVD